MLADAGLSSTCVAGQKLSRECGPFEAGGLWQVRVHTVQLFIHQLYDFIALLQCL